MHPDPDGIAVTLKLATSLDGRIATASGESQWITGEVARAVNAVSNTSHGEYLDMVERAKEYIRAGDIYQVNLSQRLTAPLPAERRSPTRLVWTSFDSRRIGERRSGSWRGRVIRAI